MEPSVIGRRGSYLKWSSVQNPKPNPSTSNKSDMEKQDTTPVKLKTPK